jgi:hypothetical protein
MWLIVGKLQRAPEPENRAWSRPGEGAFLARGGIRLTSTVLRYMVPTLRPRTLALYEEIGMPANRKPLPQKASAAMDQQFENLLNQAARYQKMHRRSAVPKKARLRTRRRRAA